LRAPGPAHCHTSAVQLMALFRNGRPLDARVLACESWFERARGLLGRRLTGRNHVLLIRPCSGVHTVGMRYRIDVVFSRADGTVLRCVRGLEPGRAAWAHGADAAWEMPAGECARLAIRVGDRLTAQRD
ncbi:MAG: DUF192 domain-containing protein, partial [Steroidobacteraceae bacterium]